MRAGPVTVDGAPSPGQVTLQPLVSVVGADGTGADETVAVVDQAGPGTDGVAVGDRVHLDRPYTPGQLVPVHAALAAALPPEMPDDWAGFVAATRQALDAVHAAGVQLGDRVVVAGLGTVGLLTVQLARAAGAVTVVGVDRVPLRLEVAETLGVTVVDTGRHEVPARVRQLTGRIGADAAVDTTAAGGDPWEVARCCRPGGRVATMAAWRRRPDGDDGRGVAVVSTAGAVPVPRRLGWDLARVDAVARQLVAAGYVRVKPLVTHRMSSTVEACTLAQSQPEQVVAIVVTHTLPAHATQG